MKKRTSLAILLLLGLLLSACGAIGGQATSSNEGNFEEFGLSSAPEAVLLDGADDAAFAAAESEARVSSLPQNAERLVIKNANISVVVDDPATTMDDLSALAESMGGFVVTRLV